MILSWPRGGPRGLSGKTRPDPTAPKTHGRAGWTPPTPLGATKQKWPPLVPCLFPKASSPVVEGGVASLSVSPDLEGKGLWKATPAPSRLCADHRRLRLFEMLQGAGVWWVVQALKNVVVFFFLWPFCRQE